MSTFMNYTYQSFNFRNRQGARPFYDLVASIAAEEDARALENLTGSDMTKLFPSPRIPTDKIPECAEELHPEGALANDLPSQPAVFAPGPEPGEIEEIAQKLREAAGLPKEPTGEVAN